MSGRFRLTKSKFQILLFIQILYFPFPFPNFANFSNFFLPNFANFSKFFQFLQKFHFLPVFSFFSKFFLYPLIWFLPRTVVFFSKMIAVAPKILLLFQILTAIFSWDWSWEFDMSWSGPRKKNSWSWKILVDIYSWERSWKARIVLVLNCPKFPNFGKAENFF